MVAEQFGSKAMHAATVGVAAAVTLLLVVRPARRRIFASILNASGASSAKEETSPTTLDPSDWWSLRRAAHALLDASFDKMERAVEGRVWTPVPDELKAALEAPLPKGSRQRSRAHTSS